MFVAYLLLMAHGADLPAPLPYPQLPNAAECERQSWDAWRSADYLAAWTWTHGSNDDTCVLLTRGRANSWWWAKIMQDPTSTHEARMEAARQLAEAIGTDGLYWGWMPPVAKPPPGWEHR